MKAAALALLGALGVTGGLFCDGAQGQTGGEIMGRAIWESGNQHEYAIVRFRDHSWDEASGDLNALLPGFHLATITSEEEQEFVNEFRLQLDPFPGQLWLGGFQLPIDEPDPAKGWRWVTGEEWGFTNWGEFEPNDGGAGEYHLALAGDHWNDEGSAIASVGGYLAERPDLIFADGLEGGCPCFTFEDARYVASHPDYSMCWDYSNVSPSDNPYTSRDGIRFSGEPDSSGLLQRSGSVDADEYGILPSEILLCQLEIKDAFSGVSEQVDWTGDPGNQEDRKKFKNCNSIIEQVADEFDLKCETSPECEERILIESTVVENGLTLTVNGSLVNIPPKQCASNVPMDRVEWYWGDGAVDIFFRMPDGNVHAFPNSHTYTDPGIHVLMIYALDAGGRILDMRGRMLILLP
jgi:hypothetical protein